jgi:hypothetical protein
MNWKQFQVFFQPFADTPHWVMPTEDVEVGLPPIAFEVLVGITSLGELKSRDPKVREGKCRISLAKPQELMLKALGGSTLPLIGL